MSFRIGQVQGKADDGPSIARNSLRALRFRLEKQNFVRVSDFLRRLFGGLDGRVRSLRTPRITWGGSWRKASPHQALSPWRRTACANPQHGVRGRRELAAPIGERWF